MKRDSLIYNILVNLFLIGLLLVLVNSDYHSNYNNINEKISCYDNHNNKIIGIECIREEYSEDRLIQIIIFSISTIILLNVFLFFIINDFNDDDYGTYY
jgi:uncharacterized membrane protein YqhA